MPADEPDQASSVGAQPLRLSLVMSALGVVFGDIATSPLYAFQAAFDEHVIGPDRDNVLGLLSLTFWSLIIVVSLKYIAFIMRADNRGEGGIMSLLALARRVSRDLPRWAYLCVVSLGLFGAAFFFGDSVITPAVSVISAVEGLQLAAPVLTQYVVPISVVILVGLFALQRIGSASVGRVFGPVMALWLIMIAAYGVSWLVRRPEVLQAVNPMHAVAYFVRNGFHGFETLGAVVLVLTGAEALYADMGHFGAQPIRIAWFSLVLPCLLLSYFGQGALLLTTPSAASMPFYKMVPGVLLYPTIAVAALATVIASQAVIAGTFSMAREAMLLGFLPRMSVDHTSKNVQGQVYLPSINAMLFVAVIFATLLFRSSDALAAAYGIAVSGTMMATTVLAIIVARRSWRWPVAVLAPLGAVLLTIDVAFFSANLLKIRSGGWFPLVIGLAMYTVMVTWHRGRAVLIEHVNRDSIDLMPFIASIKQSPPHRVEGVAVFLTARKSGVPTALLHNLKHNQVLHTTNVLLTIEILDEPLTREGKRTSMEDLGDGFHKVAVRFGFAEDTDVPGALATLGLPMFHPDAIPPTYFVSRGQVVARKLAAMWLWQAHLFSFLFRNALPATTHFRLPDNQMVEIGMRIDV